MRTEAFREVQYSRMLGGLGAFIVIGCSVAVGAVFGDLARAGVGLLGLAVLGIALFRTRLVVTVDSEGVRVSAAHIIWPYVERASVLDAEAMRAAISTDAHPSDYLRIRGTRAGLRLWLDDATDPHRCWVVSIRDVASLHGVMAALEAEGIVSAN